MDISIFDFHVSAIGELDSETPLVPESLDIIIEIVKERQRTEKSSLVTLMHDEDARQQIWSASSLEIGAKQCTAVCRIARYFSLQAFQDFITEIQKTLEQYRGITDKFDLPEKVAEIFSIPSQVYAQIFNKQAVEQISQGAKTPLEVLKDITESQLTKINPIPIGTGFLVGGNHLLTNYHVLPSQAMAEQCVAQFNYVEDVQGYTQKTTDYEFDPKVLFVYNPNLDYTLVQLKKSIFERQAGYNFEWIQLFEDDRNLKPGLTWVEINDNPEKIASLEDLGKTIIDKLISKGGYTVKINKEHGNSGIIIWHPENRYEHYEQIVDSELKELARLIGKELIQEENITKIIDTQNIDLHKKRLIWHVNGDLIIIVQHPKGKQKKIDISNNQIKENGLYNDFVRYEVNSDYGSSGSPVFNSQWHLVALHHAVITRKRNIFQQGPPIEVIAQQGIRICRIVEDLKKKSTSNPKLASFIEDFVVTSEQLNYPPFSSGLQFNGISDYVSVDGKVAFASCATNALESSDPESTKKGISTIKLWNSEGIELKTCVHVGVRKVEFSPDGTLLASAGGSDGSIKIWNVKDGALINNLIEEQQEIKEEQQEINIAREYIPKGLPIKPKKEKPQITSLSFSPPDCPLGKLLASADSDGAVKLWKLDKGTLPETPKTPEELVGKKVGFSPDGKTLISAGSFSPSTSLHNTIQIWKLENNRVIKIPSEHIMPVESISFSNDSKILATGSINGSIQLWDLENGELLNTLTGHTVSVFSIKFKSDSPTLDMSVGKDGTIIRWSLDGQSPGDTISLKGISDYEIESASFSPDGKTLATCLSKDSFKLWNVESRSMLRLKHFRANVNSNDKNDFVNTDVSFSPNVRDLHSDDGNSSKSSESFTIEAWVSPDADGGGTIASLSLKPSQGESCQFSLSITPIDDNCGYLAFNFQNSIDPRTARYIIFFGKFSHIAATIDFSKEEIKIYIDGNACKPFLIPKELFSMYDNRSFSPRLTAIAAFVENPDTAPVLRDLFKGCITEVRLWKVALTEKQIKANMSRRLTRDNSNWSDLVSYWRFEECQGDKVYNFVNADEYGAIAGAKWLRASQYPALPMPYGLRFNEENNRIECDTNNLDTPEAITVEAWVKHKFGNCLIVSRGGIVGSDGTVEKGYSLAWVDGKIRVALSDGTSQIVVYSQDNAPRDRIWHHVAFSWDKISQEVALYIDGRRQNSLIQGRSETIFSEGQYKTIGLFSGSLDSLSEPLIIGRNESDGSYYDVAIAEVRLWEKVRPQDLIKSKMSQRLKREEEGLIGYWRLDDGSEDNQEIIDLSSNKNHGKIHGERTWFPPIPPQPQAKIF
jgi:WD40 repeat protein